MTWRVLPVLTLLAVLVFGWSRVRFDADPLSLLPGDVPAVRDLKWQQNNFAEADETLVTIKGSRAGVVAAAAESLATKFNQNTNLIREAHWRSNLKQNQSAIAELLSWLWLNGPPSAFADLTNRFEPTALRQRFAVVREELATTFSPLEIARLSRDPLGLSQVSLPAGMDNPHAPDAFASRDGTFRVVRIKPRRTLGDYHDCALWMREVSAITGAWKLSRPDEGLLELKITGRPAFVAEMATGMERDMARATPCTALLVAVCFWLAHRRWRPMLWLAVLLAIIIATTLAVGGIVFGTLNAISLGFAAILLGITADYGLVLYQQLIAARGDFRQARAAVAHGIIWSAITTAGAFVSLTFGGLPGLAELGVLVCTGVLIGASVMLIFFLPHLPSIRPDQPEQTRKGFGPSEKWQSIIALVGLAAAAVFLITRGLPELRADTDAFQPSGSEAHAAMKDINVLLGESESGMLMSIHGSDEMSVSRSLAKIRPVLEGLRRDEKVNRYLLPDSLWPNPDNHRRKCQGPCP